MARNAVGDLRSNLAARQMLESRMNVIASVTHLFGVIRPGVALGLQHEIDHVGDPGDLGLFRVGQPLRSIAFGQAARAGVFATEGRS